jgi:F0F1-type ATP synthase membrane subunit c/vacuolar-type H+-ATPase subunit K
MLPVAMGALGTGILFSSYNLAMSKNPEESENLYNSTLTGFTFIESFIFISIFVAIIANILL